MMNSIHIARELASEEKSEIRYSICTFVTRPEEYKEMLDSFLEAGFSQNFCEYLYLDNSNGNKHEAFSGINHFLLQAKGEFVIICHQDILLKRDNIDVLERRIKELDELDPNWAILANAGAATIKNIVYRITEGDGSYQTRGKVPSKVMSVDENFILVKRKANLSLSRDLNGFHLYGTDLCIIANILGYSAYVVDFNLIHKSKGKADQEFYRIKKDLVRKYENAFSGKYIQTCMTNFHLSGSRWKNIFFTIRPVMFFSRQYFKLRLKFKTEGNGGSKTK